MVKDFAVTKIQPKGINLKGILDSGKKRGFGFFYYREAFMVLSIPIWMLHKALSQFISAASEVLFKVEPARLV
jgi:hypothetical protein